MVCSARPTLTPASSSKTKMGFCASSRWPKPWAISEGTQVVMCDNGPSRVLRTRSAFCTQSVADSLSLSWISLGASKVCTDNTFTEVRKPMVTKFSSKPVKRAC